MIEIPLTSDPEQLFNITIGETNYSVRVTLNSRAEKWFISFASGGVDVVRGVGLLGGVDVLKQYILGLRNAFVINLEKPKQDPGRDNLGTVARLFILTDEEIDELTV